MRIKIIQKPTLREVDGIRLDVFEAGHEYDVGHSLGPLLLAEGWAEPVIPDEPAKVIPLGNGSDSKTVAPPNLHRELFPPYYDASPAVAADRRRRRRSRPSSRS